MSFVASNTIMEEGDTVLLYLGYDNLSKLQLKKGQVFQSRYGALKHDRLIGKQFGVKVECPKGWVYPLQLTSELWTLALPHRTQILYTPDISMIVFQLHLKPGSVVVEAGTGSGSLSHALIRSVMPTGQLYTFEFHAERCAEAKKEFEQHGLSKFVTVKHRDVCAEGFDLNNEADAVFLDLPAPWECIISAKKALRPGGRISTFSPCIEQAQQTCEVLTAQGFTELLTLECLARPFSVQNVKLQDVDFGDAAQSIADKQNSQGDGPEREDSNTLPSKAKRAHTSGGKSSPKGDNVSEPCETVMEVDSTVISTEKSSSARQVSSHTKAEFEFKTGAPPLAMQGHTGFLTFASLF